MEDKSQSRLGRWYSKIRPGDFMRQLIIVILGIFLTLMATNYIANQSKKKDYRQIMEMVHAELVENKKVVDEAIGRMVFYRETMQYFYDNRDRIAELPSDTINKNYAVLRWFDDYNYTDHALEVLKYSSSIYASGDLSIVRDIMEAYDNLAICQNNITQHYEHKDQFRKELDEEVDWRVEPIVELLELQYSSRAMSDYIMVMDPYQTIRACQRASETVGRTIGILEKKYRIKAHGPSRY